MWLSPVFAMRTAKYGPHGAFHGYWVEDLTRIEPAFGGEQALAQLSSALHARGMKLILDLVLNHAAPDGKLVKEKPQWFHKRGGITDFNDPVQLVEGDVHGLPDLDQDQPEVYDYLLTSTLQWLRPGLADGLRLDAVKHMPKAFWRRFGTEVKRKAGRGVFVVGEELEGDPRKLSAAWREGGFDALFDFPLAFALNDVFCRGADPARLAAVLSNDRLYPDPSALVTLLDNHDLPRVMTVCGGDVERVKAALTALLTARGIPSLQQGTEVGLTGEKEPLNRGDMKFERGPLWAHTKALLGLRKKFPALRDGIPAVHEVGQGVVALGRVALTEKAIIAINGAGAAREVTLPAGQWQEVLRGRYFSGRTAIPPGQVWVFHQRGDFAAEAQTAEAQWRTGAEKRRVVFSLPPGEKVTGSGPELGFWTPAAAVTEALLPVGAVFEFKVVRGDQWAPGDNRILHVARGDGPLVVPLK